MGTARVSSRGNVSVLDTSRARPRIKSNPVGSLLEVPTHTVNMTILKSAHDLWQCPSMSPYDVRSSVDDVDVWSLLTRKIIL